MSDSDDAPKTRWSEKPVLLKSLIKGFKGNHSFSFLFLSLMNPSGACEKILGAFTNAVDIQSYILTESFSATDQYIRFVKGRDTDIMEKMKISIKAWLSPEKPALHLILEELRGKENGVFVADNEIYNPLRLSLEKIIQNSLHPDHGTDLQIWYHLDWADNLNENPVSQEDNTGLPDHPQLFATIRDLPGKKIDKKNIRESQNLKPGLLLEVDRKMATQEELQMGEGTEYMMINSIHLAKDVDQKTRLRLVGLEPNNLADPSLILEVMPSSLECKNPIGHVVLPRRVKVRTKEPAKPSPSKNPSEKNQKSPSQKSSDEFLDTRTLQIILSLIIGLFLLWAFIHFW